MRHLLAALATATLPCALVAQDLTEDYCIPQVGHSMLLTRYSYGGSVSFNYFGAGQTWNLPPLQPVYSTSHYTFHPPSASPYAAQYPGATLCALEIFQPGNLSYWHHYRVLPQLPDWLDAEELGVNNVPYVNGMTRAIFPLSLGQSFYDNHVHLGNFHEFTYTYLGHGTFIAPWGPVDDVVVFEVYSAQGYNYTYYRRSNMLVPIGHHNPISNLSFFRDDITTGVPGAEPSWLHVMHDPAGAAVQVMAPFGRFALRVLDGAGRLVHEEHVHADRAQVSTARLPAGVYVLQAAGPNGERAHARFVVP